MAGRKPIAINLKSTSPEGEVKFLKPFAKQLENWDSVSVELEKPETDSNPEPKPNPKPEKTLNCWICNQELNPKHRMDSRCLELEELDGDGNAIDSFLNETLYKASKISGLSLNALRNARDKGNRLLVRRRDKKQFRITWCTSYDACFKARREKEREEERKRI